MQLCSEKRGRCHTFLCFFFCTRRHWGEIHDVGADQEGVRVITTQSKAEENHYELYHRWAIDCPAQSAECVCVVCGDVCVSTCASSAGVLGITHI